MLIIGCTKKDNNQDQSSTLLLLAATQTTSTTTSGIVTTLNLTQDISKPEDLEIAADRTIYVTDSKNNRIITITDESTIQEIIPTNSGTALEINNPEGICITKNGNVYIANTGSSTDNSKGHNIIKYDVSSKAYSLYAGGVSNTTNQDIIDGTLLTARFYKPEGFYYDSVNDTFYATEANSTKGNVIRKITSSAVSTLAGSSSFATGYANGTKRDALFHTPKGIVTDSNGNIYVGDNKNNAIRKITPEGVVTTFAGSISGESGSSDGIGTTARFNGPYGLTIDSSNNIYVADGSNHTIRKITTAGVVTTIAGKAGTSGNDDGIGTTATFDSPRGIDIYENGSTKILYVTTTGGTATDIITTDNSNTTTTGSKIRKITNF